VALKAPFPYFGGKSRAADLIWSRLGDVGNYVEPFAGSLAVLLARPHEPRIETVNDRDVYISNFWRALRADAGKVAHYADWPVSECDLQARHKWLTNRAKFRERMLKEPRYFDAKVAGWWVWGISQWIGAGWCSHPEWVGRGQGGRSPRGLSANVHLSSEMGINSHSDGRNKRMVLNRGARGVTNVQERRERTTDNPDWQHRPHITDAANGVHSKRPHLSGNGSTGVHRKLPLMPRSNKRGAQNPAILPWLLDLAERLRRVRVCCGDWKRIVTPSCTWKLGGGQLTGVLLDPPYSHGMRDNRLYSIEHDIAAEVRNWALANGDNRNLRIALCGLEGEHDMPGWEAAPWIPGRGYSNKARRREVIWFSPACLRQGNLFSGEASA
jgi:site-specific DNA-adenine methylase